MVVVPEFLFIGGLDCFIVRWVVVVGCGVGIWVVGCCGGYCLW